MKLRKLGPNKTEITFGNWTVFFSYNTPVAACDNGSGFYKTDEKFSVTTSKHINQWLDGRRTTVKPQSFFDDLAGGV